MKKALRKNQKRNYYIEYQLSNDILDELGDFGIRVVNVKLRNILNRIRDNGDSLLIGSSILLDCGNDYTLIFYIESIDYFDNTTMVNFKDCSIC